MIKNLLKFNIVIIMLGAIVCCRNEKVTKTNINESIIVQLENKLNTDFEFDYRKTDFLLYPYEEKYPKYYTELLKKSSNIPKLDSFKIVSYSFQTGKLLNYLTKNDFFKSEADRLKLKYFLKDTTKRIEKKYNHQINAISGYKDGKQIVIVDKNGNYNFGDESPIFLNQKLNDDNKITNDHFLSASYQIATYNKIKKLDRRFEIDFGANHPFIGTINVKLRPYALNLKLKDYWKGSFYLNDHLYEIAIQGQSKYDNNIILLRPSKLNNNKGKAYDKNFIYYLTDTMNISDNYYRIDSIYDDMTKLILKKVKIENPFYSYRLGYNIRDYSLKTFDQTEKNISELQKNQYTLLDFWGTWCAPCKKVTPDLLKINKKFQNQLDIVGIAYKSSLDDSKKYVFENNMNWSHTYSKGRAGIIRDLNITSYPTFILLDSNRKILYRGTGKKALQEIEKFLSNN